MILLIMNIIRFYGYDGGWVSGLRLLGLLGLGLGLGVDIVKIVMAKISTFESMKIYNLFFHRLKIDSLRDASK